MVVFLREDSVVFLREDSVVVFAKSAVLTLSFTHTVDFDTFLHFWHFWNHPLFVSFLESSLVCVISGLIRGFAQSPLRRAVILDIKSHNFHENDDILPILVIFSKTH